LLAASTSSGDATATTTPLFLTASIASVKFLKSFKLVRHKTVPEQQMVSNDSLVLLQQVNNRIQGQHKLAKYLKNVSKHTCNRCHPTDKKSAVLKFSFDSRIRKKVLRLLLTTTESEMY